MYLADLEGVAFRLLEGSPPPLSLSLLRGLPWQFAVISHCRIIQALLCLPLSLGGSNRNTAIVARPPETSNGWLARFLRCCNSYTNLSPLAPRTTPWLSSMYAHLGTHTCPQEC